MKSRDKEFSERLVATLDSSIDTLDADTRARLAVLRHTALTQNRNRRIAGGFAIAASVIALVLMPWSLRQHGSGVAETPVEDVAYLSVDPQLLDDMDMLQGLSELQIGDASAAQGDS